MTEQKDTETTAPKRSQKTLVAILLVSVLPLVLAYTMFFTGVGIPDQTKNNGFLLTPAVNTADLLGPGQQAVHAQWMEDKKWRLLIPVPANCNDACEENLYTTRQVHIRLGEKGLRVERVAVSLSGEESMDYLASIKPEHPKLDVVSASEAEWQQWLAETNLAHKEPDHYYLLVDQEGFAMMWYTVEIHGNDLLKDIKHALKYSIDYQ